METTDLKIQELRERSDLESLTQGEIINIKDMGPMVYETRENNKLIFINRISMDCIMELRVERNIIKIKEGHLDFKAGAAYSGVCRSNQDGYKFKDKLLKKAGL